MTALTLASIAEIVQGENLSPSAGTLLIKAFSKDSRSIQAGELYIAIAGEQFDGHQFVKQAEQAGASAALVQRVVEGVALPQIKVADTLLALGALAAYNREQFTGPVVAITGSAGKTSTKQLTHAVLSQQYTTLMTQGNLNNHIGAPLTLLELNSTVQAAVIELGASHEGEIAYTARWVKPQVAIITNAAEAHLEGFGDLDGVVRTKGELLDYIQPQGVAVLNVDDPYVSQWLSRAERQQVGQVLLFGFAELADVRAVNLVCDLNGSQFELIYRGRHRMVNLPLLGAHSVSNALAAAAAGLALGLTLDQVVAGLESVQAVAGRLQQLTGAQGQSIFNDAYNANPASVRAAIDVLAQAKNSWLVLGDMAELGVAEISEHQAIGEYAKAHNIQHLLATGTLAKHAVEAFGAGGQWFASQTELVEYLQQHTSFSDVILVKGSRSAGMDRVVTLLQTPQSQEIKEH